MPASDTYKRALKILNKRNYEFYEFIESNYYDLEERLTVFERKVKELS